MHFRWLQSLRISLSIFCLLMLTVAARAQCPSITFTPSSLLNGSLGALYAQSPQATGGQAPYVYTIALGALPPGLSLNTSTGVISGRPEELGSFSFTLRARDANGCFGLRLYTITVSCPTISLNRNSLPDGDLGVAYSQALSGVGGTAPYAFSLAFQALPPGLTISSGGTISGTPTMVGSFPFTLRVQDANECFTYKAFTITIDPACTPVSITPLGLPDGATGAPYAQNLEATGGSNARFTYSLVANSLPPGLTLQSSTGRISGTPTTTGTYSFQVRATDANGCAGTRAYTITISCGTITMTPGSPLSATVGVPYSQSFTASGTRAPYSLQLIGGSLPPGLSLNGAGTLAGTPTTVGNASFTLRATDGNGCQTERSYAMNVVCPTITFNPQTLPGGAVGATYAQNLTPNGGRSPYEFGLQAGALPPGLTLSATGTIAGTPTQAGSFPFVVRARDANGCGGSLAFTLVVTCATIAIDPGALPTAVVGAPYPYALTASGGRAPYEFAIQSGALPPGIAMATAGKFDGAPTQPGSFSFVVRARDANGCTGSASITLVVTCATLSLTPASGPLPNATVNAPYSQTFIASGGTAPYSYKIAAQPNLQSQSGATNGLRFDPTTGTLSGTPISAGTYAFTIEATDANQCRGVRAYTLVVNPPVCPAIAIAPAALPAGSAGAGYSQSFAANGGAGSYAFALVAGALPNGLTLTASGALSGTTDATGSFPFTMRATDANGCAGERAYLLVIAANPFTSVSAANFQPNAPLAPESIVAGFGTNLTAATTAATTLPLPTSLAGLTLKVRDSAGTERLAPLFFISPMQINYLLPPGTSTGPSAIAVVSNGAPVGEGSLEIATVSPGMFSADGSGRGLASALALRIRSNGAQSFEPIARYDSAAGRFVALPIDVSNPADQVYLVFYGTGLKFRSALSAVTCAIGGLASDVLYAGEVAGFVGYDQINVRLASSLAGRGEVDVVITVDGKTANPVRIAIQ